MNWSFKKGDRVVVLKNFYGHHGIRPGITLIVNTILPNGVVVARVKHSQPCTYRPKDLIPEHIYNSRLYKALNEDT